MSTGQVQGVNLWLSLPDEIALLPLSYLDDLELVRISTVCKRFLCLAATPSLWNEQLEHRFAITPQGEEKNCPKKLYQVLYLQATSDTHALNKDLQQHLEKAGKDGKLPFPTTLISTLFQKYRTAFRVTWGMNAKCMRVWDHIGSKTIEALSKNAQFLTSFSLEATSDLQFPQILDADLIGLATAHPEVEKFHLEGCCNVSEEGILEVLELLPKLRSLYLSNRNLLTLRVAEKIMELSVLEELTLQGEAINLSPTSLEMIKQNCPSLKPDKTHFSLRA